MQLELIFLLAEPELVERYFAELSLWTLADLKLFANISCVLPFELMENLLA